jgi:hypothetical protein
MNKFIAIALAAGSLLLLDSTPAAAHNDARDKHSRSDDHYSRSYDRDFKTYRGHRRGYYETRYKRSKHMPRWLKKDRAFRHWYKHTHLRANYRISWNQLFDIYIYEHRFHSYRRY